MARRRIRNNENNCKSEVSKADDTTKNVKRTQKESKKKKENVGGECSKVTMKSCDFMLLSQSAAEAEIVWNDSPIIGNQNKNSNIDDLVKKFTVNGSGTEPPSTPPLVSLWMDSPDNSEKKKKSIVDYRRPVRKTGKMIRKKIAPKFLQDPTIMLNKLTAVLKANPDLLEKENSLLRTKNNSADTVEDKTANRNNCNTANICVSTQKPQVPMRSSPLESTCMSPILQKSQGNRSLNESPQETLLAIDSAIMDTPTSALPKRRTNGQLDALETPKSAWKNMSSDELWTDEELFEHDSFLKATQIDKDIYTTPSPRNSKRKLSTPYGGEKKRHTFQLQASSPAEEQIINTNKETKANSVFFKQPQPIPAAQTYNKFSENRQKNTTMSLFESVSSNDTNLSKECINPFSVSDNVFQNNSDKMEPISNSTKHLSSVKQNISNKVQQNCEQLYDNSLAMVNSTKNSKIASVAHTVASKDKPYHDNILSTSSFNCQKDSLHTSTANCVPFNNLNNMQTNSKTQISLKQSNNSKLNMSSQFDKTSKVNKVSVKSSVHSDKSLDHQQHTSSSNTFSKDKKPYTGVKTAQPESTKIVPITMKNTYSNNNKNNVVNDIDMDMSISEELLASLAQPDDILDSQAFMFDESMTESQFSADKNINKDEKLQLPKTNTNCAKGKKLPAQLNKPASLHSQVDLKSNTPRTNSIVSNTRNFHCANMKRTTNSLAYGGTVVTSNTTNTSQVVIQENCFKNTKLSSVTSSTGSVDKVSADQNTQNCTSSKPQNAMSARGVVSDQKVNQLPNNICINSVKEKQCNSTLSNDSQLANISIDVPLAMSTQKSIKPVGQKESMSSQKGRFTFKLSVGYNSPKLEQEKSWYETNGQLPKESFTDKVNMTTCGPSLESSSHASIGSTVILSDGSTDNTIDDELGEDELLALLEQSESVINMESANKYEKTCNSSSKVKSDVTKKNTAYHKDGVKKSSICRNNQAAVGKNVTTLSETGVVINKRENSIAKTPPLPKENIYSKENIGNFSSTREVSKQNTSTFSNTITDTKNKAGRFNNTVSKPGRTFQKFPSYGTLNIHDSPKADISTCVSSSQDSKRIVATYAPQEIEKKRQEALKRRQNKLKLTKKKPV